MVRYSFISRLLLVLLILSGSLAAGNMKRGNSASGFRIASGARLVVTKNFNAGSGSIIVDEGGALEGTDEESKVTFSGGTLQNSEGVETQISGELNLKSGTETTGTVRLLGSDVLVAHPGRVLDNIEVSGIANRLEGQPTLTSPIKIIDSTSQLIVGIQSTLNQNIELNGGTLSLNDNLACGRGIFMVGPGKISTDGYAVMTASAPLTQNTDLTWQNGSHIVLNNPVTLDAVWEIEGQVTLTGNGSVLDLTNGGIHLKEGAQLTIADTIIKGAHTGTFLFDHDNGQVRLSQVTMVLDNHFDLPNGLLYINGDTKFLCNQYDFILSGSSGITINGSQLEYDSLQFNFIDENSGKLNLINNGSIRDMNSDTAVASLDITETTVLTSNYFLDNNDKLTVSLGSDPVVNLDFLGHSVEFSHALNTDEKLFIIEAGVACSVQNLRLLNFAPGQLFIDPSASLRFENNVLIDLDEGAQLNQALTFGGTCVINGHGEVFDMGSNGSIEVEDNSTLTLKNIFFKNLSGAAIKCLGANAKIIFENVTLELSDNYTFGQGSFEVSQDLFVRGGKRFIYTTNKKSIIRSQSCLALLADTTFVYQTSGIDQTLIEYSDKSSEILLHNSTLETSEVGMQLTKGTLIVRQNGTIESKGADRAHACIFGDGISSTNNVSIKLEKDANLITHGHIDHQDAV